MVRFVCFRLKNAGCSRERKRAINLLKWKGGVVKKSRKKKNSPGKIKENSEK